MGKADGKKPDKKNGMRDGMKGNKNKEIVSESYESPFSTVIEYKIRHKGFTEALLGQMTMQNYLKER